MLTNGSSSIDKMLEAGKHLDRILLSVHYSQNIKDLENKISRLKFELPCDLKLRILNDPLHQKEIQNLINTCEGLNIWYEVINIVDEFSEG